MTTTTILRGTEEDTLEIDGTLPDGTAVNVLFFAMSGLKMRGTPFGFDYNEALWRRAEGEDAWLAVACDLDSALIRAFGRRIVRYPARKASFVFARGRVSELAARQLLRLPSRWSVRTDSGSLSVQVTEQNESPDPIRPRRTLVRERGDRTWEIPWEEIPAPFRRVATVAILSDTLSEPTFGARVEWSPAGLVHRGRIHMCGVARRVSS